MDNFTKTSTITRFAPSPTGYLHLGGARTALFNWIFAKKFKGKFLLRIEDTDKSRLNKKALSAIFDGLKWLGINWNDEVIYQSERDKQYREVVEKLLQEGYAYRCYSSKDEIDNFKNKLLKLGKTTKFISPWREKTNNKTNNQYVVRFKVPESGEIKIKDGVQGDITWNCKNLEDLILLRSDGSATYNLAAVVDDHDTNVSDVIRGDDHLTNTASQKLIYNALNWEIPRFSHIPLIHGFDGKKLSKRHGAVSVNSYINDGIKSSALVRYLCQLGLDTGNDELRSIDNIIKDFEIKKIVKSPARFDSVKLNDICSKIIRNTDDETIINDLIYFLSYSKMPTLTQNQQDKIKTALPFLKIRSKNFYELYKQSKFILIKDIITLNEESKELITNKNILLIKALSEKLKNIKWAKDNINKTIKSFALENNKDFKDIAKLIRIAIVGSSNSPGIYDMMIVLGKIEVIRRFTILEI
ncbi:MAG: glutamate--tRNA ligase [Paracoccaceae bacterium]